MTDMRYMGQLELVVEDAVGLIRQKSEGYGDSWKRRGGQGAWFTTVRPIDRLEGILQNYGGDIFAAIEAHPEGQDGSALACVRDIMNYMVLIEAHARVAHGAGPHGPTRKAELNCDNCGIQYKPEEQWTDVRNQDKHFCGPVCCRRYHGESEPSPASGSHHADRDEGFPGGARVCGECGSGPGHTAQCSRGVRIVPQDPRAAAPSAGRAHYGPPGERLEGFRRALLLASEEYGVPVELRTTALGEMIVVEIDLRKIER